MKIVHARATPVRKLSNSISVKHIPACESVVLSGLHSLSQALQQKDDYEHMFRNNYAPDQPRKKYEYIQTLANNGVCSSIVLFTHSSGNNSGNLNFVWKASSNVEESFDRSVQVIEEIKPLLPVFPTRAMRKMMFETFGRISPSVKPAVLRYFYRDLTGDCSASHDLQESIIIGILTVIVCSTCMKLHGSSFIFSIHLKYYTIVVDESFQVKGKGKD